MSDFAAFIAPFDSNAFRSQYFGRQPLLVTRQGRTFANPLSWRQFNELLGLNSYWTEDTLKVYYHSRSALVDNYCDLSRAVPGRPAPVDARKVQALAGLGASIVANSVNRVSPEIRALTQMLAAEFSAACHANVYCSFPQVQAFSTHFDLHDVFALQLEGEKRWNVYEARADNPVEPVSPGDAAERWLIENRGRVVMDPTLRPGDLLYLPRGQFHDAITGSEPSLHVTFGLEPATGLALFKLLEMHAARISEFRTHLPERQQLAGHLAQLGKKLYELTTSAAFAVDVRNHQRSLCASAPEFELPKCEIPQYYAPVQPAQVLQRPNGYVLATAQGEMSLGQSYAPIDCIIRQQRAMSLSDLLARFPYVEAAELLTLLRTLVARGVLAEVAINK